MGNDINDPGVLWLVASDFKSYLSGRCSRVYVSTTLQSNSGHGSGGNGGDLNYFYPAAATDPKEPTQAVTVERHPGMGNRAILTPNLKCAAFFSSCD